jgi:hypothetical protein
VQPPVLGGTFVPFVPITPAGTYTFGPFTIPNTFTNFPGFPGFAAP